jgi:hypothetical protein
MSKPLFILESDRKLPAEVIRSVHELFALAGVQVVILPKGLHCTQVSVTP